MARDATAVGDRIAAEGYYQFAEHYYRMVNDSTDPHADGQRRFDPGRDGQQPRGDGQYASDQPVMPRGNGTAHGGTAHGGDGGSGDGGRGRADGDTSPDVAGGSDAASEPRGEAGPRRRGLRRRKPANGNGAAEPDDGEEQELASSDNDTDVACP
jgi:hypothetical protein